MGILKDDVAKILPPNGGALAAVVERRYSQRIGCTLTAWESHREATSKITRGQDRHDRRPAWNRFETICENAVDWTRIVEPRSYTLDRVSDTAGGVNLLPTGA